jgi:hypothetical protein
MDVLTDAPVVLNCLELTAWIEEAASLLELPISLDVCAAPAWLDEVDVLPGLPCWLDDSGRPASPDGPEVPAISLELIVCSDDIADNDRPNELEAPPALLEFVIGVLDSETEDEAGPRAPAELVELTEPEDAWAKEPNPTLPDTEVLKPRGGRIELLVEPMKDEVVERLRTTEVEGFVE